jgi:hypothetical protein
VPDVGTTARWYQVNLGFALAGHFPDAEPWAYASLQLGGAEIMLLGLPGYVKPEAVALRQAGGWDAYIRMDGVEALYRALEEKDFIRMPLKLQPYENWEFEVRDPNGYILAFGGGR